MSAVLDTKIEDMETLRATQPGRFFYTPEELAQFSSEFYKENEELLPKGGGVVLAVGLDEHGKLSDLDQHDRAKDIQTVMVSFDAREQESGNYTWELSVAEIYGKVVVLGVKFVDGEVFGCRWAYDAQGVEKEVTALNDEELVHAVSSIMFFMELPIAKQIEDKVRKKAVDTRRENIRFQAEIESKYGPERVKKLLKKRSLDKYGYLAIMPRFELV